MNRLSFIAAIVVFLAAVSCAPSNEYRETDGETMGTVYHIKYRHDSDLADSVRNVLAQINASLSPFDRSSQLARINAGEDVVADSMLREVMAISQKVWTLSGGAFDPTLAPLINLWGFGYEDDGNDRPSKERIDSAMALVGLDACGIAADGRVIRKHPKTEFNFSAVAKGYGVDKVAEMLRRNGVTDYMVEIGGEIALCGSGPRGDKWNIQIDAPVDDPGGLVHEQMRVLCTTDECIATSGNYRNYRETPQGRVWHTISPVTGYPVQTSTLSATVIAPTCAEADALATAVMAMPLDSAIAMIKAVPNARAMITTAKDGGGYDVHSVE